MKHTQLQTCSASSRTSSISLRTMDQWCSEGKFLREAGSSQPSIRVGNESCVFEVPAQILRSQGYLQCGNVDVTQRDNVLPEQYKEQHPHRTFEPAAVILSCLIVSSSCCYCCGFPHGHRLCRIKVIAPVSVSLCWCWVLSVTAKWQGHAVPLEVFPAHSWTIGCILFFIPLTLRPNKIVPNTLPGGWRPVGLRGTAERAI